jgi:hypothetical protein
MIDCVGRHWQQTQDAARWHIMLPIDSGGKGGTTGLDKVTDVSRLLIVHGGSFSRLDA